MKRESSVIKLANGLTHQPRKRFGQNFLHDQNAIEKIIDAISPCKEHHIVEIGPGYGALTNPLFKSGAKLDCVEIDQDLAKFIDHKFGNSKNFQVFQEDILKFDLALLSKKEQTLRIVGNLPYNISTPVIFHLLKNHRLIADMIFMLQLEVIQRMSSNVGDKNYGRLSLMAQYYCEVEHLFNVPSSSFTPKPKVVSAIVRLKPHQKFPVKAKDPGCLQNVIRTAFNQRRKTLKNSLKTVVSNSILDKLPIDTNLRPENLTLKDYVTISDAISG
jgi:16S rRNA (adenine1518-N6/adenine1519-N6)-dimethyltransferase